MTMPDGGLFLAIVDVAWLVLLIFGAIVLRREVAIIERRLLVAGRAVPDGPEVGSPVPRSPDRRKNRVLVFLYADCEPCHDLIPAFQSLSRPDLVEVVIGDSRDTRGGRRVIEAASFRPLTVISADEAERLARVFRVHSAPLAVGTRNGLVVAKSYLRSTRDIERVVEDVA